MKKQVYLRKKAAAEAEAKAAAEAEAAYKAKQASQQQKSRCFWEYNFYSRSSSSINYFFVI